MDYVHVVKRHGSKIHAKTSNYFALVSLVLLLVYSALFAVSRRSRRLQKPAQFLSSGIFLTILWTILCSWAIFHHFNSDMLQIARRYGQISIATATLTVFISLKPAILPYTYQTSMISIHKWMGRTSIFLGVVHGMIYFVSYLRKSTSSSATAHHEISTNGTANIEASLLAKRHEGHHLFSLFNIYGMVAFMAFIIIFATTLGPFRRRVYFLFYALHRPLVILIYVMMIWHARPSAWIMVTTGLLILMIQPVLRVIFSRNVTIETVQTFGKNLNLVTFSPHLLEHNLKNEGSHVRISGLLHNPIQFFRPSHPYTIVGTDTVVVRTTRFVLNEGVAYSLFGPFSSPLDASQYTHFIVIAGGSGVSMMPRFAKMQNKTIKLIWVTKNSAETAILPKLGINKCDVYITGNQTEDEAESFELQEYDIDSDYDDENDNAGLLSQSQRKEKDIKRNRGRPDFTAATEDFLRESTNVTDARICVIACGPESLVTSAKSWASSQKLEIWSENYSL